MLSKQPILQKQQCLRKEQHQYIMLRMHQALSNHLRLLWNLWNQMNDRISRESERYVCLRLMRRLNSHAAQALLGHGAKIGLLSKPRTCPGTTSS